MACEDIFGNRKKREAVRNVNIYELGVTRLSARTHVRYEIRCVQMANPGIDRVTFYMHGEGSMLDGIINNE